MILKEKEGLRFLQYELLSEFTRVKHATFQKHGGLSKGSYDSLNTSFSVGDEADAVKGNLEKVQTFLDLPKLAIAGQVHGDIIIEALDTGTAGEGDALITRTLNLGLGIRHADCQAALFYDPVLHVAAAVHAGWRGNVQDIYRKAIDRLRSQYGSKPANLLVCISPSLGPEASEFIHYRQEFPSSFWPYQIKPNYFDLWAIAEDQLLNAGIKAHHIEIARICTYGNPQDYFSYRREKISGRLISVIALN